MNSILQEKTSFKSYSSMMRQCLPFWLVGGMSFLIIEAIDNLRQGRLFISSLEPVVILLIYLAIMFLGATFWSGVRYYLHKICSKGIEINSWCAVTFFTSWVFVYILLWINNKNPYSFFAPVSIVVNCILLFVFVVPSLIIYKAFSLAEKKRYRYTFLGYCAFCLSVNAYVIFTLSLNWQKYRNSVEMAEKFFTLDMVIYNVNLLGGAVLLFALFFLLFVLFSKLIKRYLLVRSKTLFNGIAAIIFLGCVLLLTTKFTEQGEISDFTPRFENRPNIILISIDAVRVDHVGCYGYDKPTTPNIDLLAKEGILFENCITPFTHTRTALPSILSSRYVTLSRVKNKQFVKELVYLQEYLRRAGYLTGMFAGINFYGKELTGLDRGFDYFPTQWGSYFEYFWPRTFITIRNVIYTHKYGQHSWVADAGRLVNNCCLWIEKNRNCNFFAFLDMVNSHSPYHVPDSFNRYFFKGNSKQAYALGKEWETQLDKIDKTKLIDVIALYDDAIRYEDENIARVIAKLKELGIYQNSLIVILADHGESFLDHGTTHHSRSIYDEIIRTPLIIKLPGVNSRGKKIKDLVETIDIMPTILDMAKANYPKNIDGKSLLSLCSGGGPDLTTPHREFTISLKEGNFIGLRTGKWKLVIANESKREFFGTRVFGHKDVKELFDLESDPYELKNVYSIYKDDPEIKGLEETLLRYKDRLYQ